MYKLFDTESWDAFKKLIASLYSKVSAIDFEEITDDEIDEIFEGLE